MPDAPSNRWRHLLFPFLEWLGTYRVSFLQNDALAGLTVAVVLIPQSMAYAMLAGLPPVYGLYAAAVTPMVAALWGSLRQLATGPIAIMSLLVLTTLSPMAEPGSREFIELAFLLAFMVGCFYLGIGVFRLGMVMSFISHSAVRGFTSAAALIIISTQLPHFMGLSVARHEYVISIFIELVRKLATVHFPTLVVGLVSFAMIYGLKKINRNFPSGLLAMVLTTAAVVLLDLDQHGVAIVGKSPKGLPHPHWPLMDFRIISSFIGPAVVIGLVSFAETYSIGKAIAGETKQKVNVDQEFIGQGLANIVGSFFQSYPVSGSFSRSAINYAAGAKTGLASVISSLIVVLALLFFTPLFTYIPRAALAALVISAVLLLFHPRKILELWRENRHDGIVAVTVFVLALLTKPDYALLIGVMASLMFFLWKTMRPRIVRISKDPDFNMFVNADLYNKPSCPQILQLRPDNAIYFANAGYTVEQLIGRLDAQTTPVKFLLLDFQAVGFIDITGIDELRTLKEEMDARGVRLAFMTLHLPVKQVFETSRLIKKLDARLFFDRREDAIAMLFMLLDQSYCRQVCPHALFHECFTIKPKPEASSPGA